MGWVVGWEFLGKTALNATLHGSDVSSERDSTRDRAMVAMLLGCGLRRSELLSVAVKTIQQREDHCPF